MSLLSLYGLGYASVLTHMLQSTGYQIGAYLRWYWRTQDFDKITRYGKLDVTTSARLLLWALRLGMFLQIVLGTGLVVLWGWQGLAWGWQVGLALLLSYPIVWAHMAAISLALGQWLISKPLHARAIKRSEAIFAGHPGVKLAVIGSYGKTSMKELLRTVLGEARKIAVTSVNKNVLVDGDEDILVIEYDGDMPSDIARYAKRTHPTHAVITGLAAARSDSIKFLIADYVSQGHVYVNGDAKLNLSKQMHIYNEQGVLGWKVIRIKVTVAGTSFTLAKNKRKLTLASSLLGRHNIGPLAFAAVFGLELGLNDRQICDGVAKTTPLEHRMQPSYVSGALVIDDTYNNNLEGMRAGTALLRELTAKRKWYITPGLAGQGHMTAKVHHEIGQLIADAKPDTVVLMDNPVADYITAGLTVAGYQGEVRVEADPLHFYTNLPHRIAAGDLVMMQNDWTVSV